MRYLGTCDGNMDEGSMRADVNVSVCRVGGYEKFRETGDFKHLGTRCEIKNVNSMRFIAQAVEYEARRQVEIIEGGGTIKQETRLFDARAGETRSMRSKEEAHDYRYFPDPDLLPLELDAGLGGGDREVAAGTAGREEGALHASWAFRPMTPPCWWPNARLADYFEELAQGRRRQGGRQLAEQ